MERTEEPIIFLDTHAIVWLYDRLFNKFSTATKQLLETSQLYISPIVLLELKYLKEINRIKPEPEHIIDHLAVTTGLKISQSYFKDIVSCAIEQTWTRDLFDRMITAEAAFYNAPLVSSDKKLKANYELTLI